jgi:hypothetical protein
MERRGGLALRREEEGSTKAALTFNEEAESSAATERMKGGDAALLLRGQLAVA